MNIDNALLEAYRWMDNDGRFDNMVIISGGIEFNAVLQTELGMFLSDTTRMFIEDEMVRIEYRGHEYKEEIVWDEEFPMSESIIEAMEAIIEPFYEQATADLNDFSE